MTAIRNTGVRRHWVGWAIGLSNGWVFIQRALRHEMNMSLQSNGSFLLGLRVDAKGRPYNLWDDYLGRWRVRVVDESRHNKVCSASYVGSRKFPGELVFTFYPGSLRYDGDSREVNKNAGADDRGHLCDG